MSFHSNVKGYLISEERKVPSGNIPASQITLEDVFIVGLIGKDSDVSEIHYVSVM